MHSFSSNKSFSNKRKGSNDNDWSSKRHKTQQNQTRDSNAKTISIARNLAPVQVLAIVGQRKKPSSTTRWTRAVLATIFVPHLEVIGRISKKNDYLEVNNVKACCPKIPVGGRLIYFLDQWKQITGRSMGPFNNTRRVQIRISGNSEKHRNKIHICTCKKSGYFRFRDK